MNIYSAYYRQEGERANFLLLQQARRKDDTDIILSFIADKNDACERLLVWFREELTGYYRDIGFQGAEGLKKGVDSELKRISSRNPEIEYGGLIIVGDEYLGFCRGHYGIYLSVNMFLRDRMTTLIKGDNAEKCMISGRFSGNLGMLLCNDAYYEAVNKYMDRDELTAVLKAEKGLEERRVEKRFRELSERIDVGSRAMSAVYIAVTEGE